MTRGLRADRPDHRWLRLLIRVARRGGGALDAWAFHRRSPGVVAEELAARAARDDLDAGDAVLVMSLLALWQRRRPTAHARGNRGQVRPRRTTPKPVAGVRDTLAAAGQLRHLGRLAKMLGGERARAVLLLGIEAGLTEAHLAPHAARLSQQGAPDTGEGWLRGIEQVVHEHAVLLAEDAAVLRFRIDRMRAWRDRVEQPLPHEDAVRFAYVRASLDLEHTHAASAVDEPVHASTPGLLMLLPLLRARGFAVAP